MRNGQLLNNSLFIRQASETDVPFIYRLQQQMSEEDGIYGFVPETVEQIEKAINPYFLVAEAGDEIIGFISGDVSVSDGSAVIPKDEKYSQSKSGCHANPLARRCAV